MSAFSAALPVEAPFELAPGAYVLFTTRASGNLSSRSGEGRQHAAQAREGLRERLELRALGHAHQVHGVTVRRLSDDPAPADGSGDAEADGHMQRARASWAARVHRRLPAGGARLR